MSDGSSSAPEQSPDSPPSDSSETPPPPSDSTTLSPPPSDSSSSPLLSSPPPPEAAAAEQPPPTVEAQSSPPPPDGGSGGGGGGGGNVGQSPPVPAAQVVGPTPPGGGPREVPRLAPPRSSDNQTSSTNGNEVSTAQSTSNNSHGNSNNTALIVGVVALGGILLLLVIICVLCGRKKKKPPSHGPPYGWEGPPKPHPQGNQYWQSSPQDHAVKIPPPSGGWGQHSSGGVAESGGLNTGGGNTSLAPSPSLTLGYNKSSFSYEELAAATNNFDKSRMLGQGGFGYVHKGTLPNGKEIAVKSLKSGSGQGEREFQSEVEIISRVHHRHLVSLVGYCIAGGQRMLVYEFVPNDTLEFHLHKKDPPLDFPTRLRIALGSAKGLSYLHEDCHPRIIHRDIKASNILLDENFEAMVADFGLAKLTTDTNTHVSTRVMGTFGYLAPEYASSGKLTEKSDVFSYGVMLLELITGRRPVDPNMKYMEDSLVDWSRPLLAKALETGNYDELADPRLERIYNPPEMQRMVACAAASIRHSAKKRPKMSQIVRALEGDVSLDDLNEGTRGGQSTAFSSSEGGSDYDTRQYNADLKKFRQMAFETQDFASKEHGGDTNDYGLNQSSSSDNSREMNDKLHRPF